MTISDSRQAYLDCYEVFDKAIATTLGVRVKMTTWDGAIHFRMRLHQARKINRRDNQEVYEVGHPMHGASDYDRYTVRVRYVGDDIYVFVEPNLINIESIESLDKIINDEDVETIEASPEPMFEEPSVEEMLGPKVARRV